VAWFETNGIRLGGVAVDCNDLDVQLRFWTSALGYEVQDRGGTYALLRHPSSAGPKLYLQRVVEPKVGRNRVHIDLYAVDAERVIDWLSSLGARRLRRHSGDGESWYVMLDPEGNEFYVITAGPVGFANPYA
jgi:catechol 2,3-dioxygenase-like lactoylglutathione lyase family enzyme